MTVSLCVRWTRACAYVADVLAGRIAVGRFERLAVERHARDMRRAEAGGPFVFEAVRAERALRFLESLPHVKGDLAARGETMQLEGWQAFAIGSLFGWVRRDSGLRRFRTAYFEVARKNGKSTLLSGVGLYCLALDGEAGAEVYSAATTKDQARKVFDPARDMARRHPQLLAKAGVRALQHRIEHPASGGVFLPLASQTNSLDGSNPSCTLVDELHAHRSREVWDVLGSGSGARRQPLMIAITTAGSDLAGVCYEERSYVEKLLLGVFEDDSYFGIIFALDEEDDPFDAAVWRKANPNLGVSISAEYLQTEAVKASRIASRRGEFLRKHCCRWSAAGVGAFDLDAWRASADPAMRLEDFADIDGVVIGLDGSKTDDLTALAVMGWRGQRLLCWTEAWATEAAAASEGGEHLRRWAEDGLLTLCPGALIDMGLPEPERPDGAPGMLFRRLCEIVDIVKPAEIAYDPIYLGGVAAALAARFGDAPLVVEQRQNIISLDPSLRTAQGLIRDRRLVGRGDPVMDWMLSNARAKPRGEFLQVFKQMTTAKIDGVQAMLTAMARMAAPAEDVKPSYLESDPLMVLG